MNSVPKEELETRVCVKCGRSHPEVMFQGYRKQCNSCAYYRYAADHRNHNLKKNYGITSDQYDKLLEKQNFGCSVCETKSPGGKSGKFFHVDHDHETGEVRGLLCSGCNLALGPRRNPEPHRPAIVTSQGVPPDTRLSTKPTKSYRTPVPIAPFP